MNEKIKNVLIVSQYYYPEQFMINNIAEKLNKLGYKATVLTGIPNYPMGKIISPYRNRFHHEFINGVEVFRVPMFLRGKGIKMILNYLSYAVTASVRSLFLKEKFDYIFVFEVSPVTQIFPAYIYKKLKNHNAKLIVNCQDIWPEVLKSNGFYENSFIYKLGYKISDFLYKTADLLLISSRLFKNYLIENFSLSDNKIEYLPNYADDWVLNVKNKQNNDGKEHFLFAGNLGKAQKLDLIIKAISICENKEKMIVDFVGDGSETENLKKLASELSLNKILRFHGRHTGDTLTKFYDEASAFLLTLNCENKICYTVPSKVQGYMGAGKPILASILGGAKEIINESESGKVVEYNDIQQYANLLDDFVINKKLYNKLGDNGRAYFLDNFTEEIYINKLINLMKEMDK